MATWIARNSDSAWMVQGFGDPSLILSQPGSYTAVSVPGDVCPDPRTSRHDANAASKVRAATAPEVTAYDDAVLDAKSQMTSRQKDILATCANIVRARGIAAWNALTTQQKIDATLAEADIWKTHRIFAEKNF